MLVSSGSQETNGRAIATEYEKSWWLVNQFLILFNQRAARALQLKARRESADTQVTTDSARLGLYNGYLPTHTNTWYDSRPLARELRNVRNQKRAMD